MGVIGVSAAVFALSLPLLQRILVTRSDWVHVQPSVDATFCGLAGVNATDDAPGMPGIDSIDQWAYITGSVVDSPRTEILLASAFAAKPSNDASAANGSAALLVGKYKLVRYAQQVRLGSHAFPCVARLPTHS